VNHEKVFDHKKRLAIQRRISARRSRANRELNFTWRVSNKEGELAGEANDEKFQCPELIARK